MKTIVTIFSLLFASSVLANYAVWGPYIGAQTGYVSPHSKYTLPEWPNKGIPFWSKSGSRAFVGFRFDENIAIEAGYDSLLDRVVHDNSIGKRKKATQDGYDLVAKGIVPLSYNFEVYLRGGAANIHQNILNTLNNGQIITYKKSCYRIMPLVGMGAGYNFAKYFNVDLSFNRFVGTGPIKNIDYAALGLSAILNLS